MADMGIKVTASVNSAKLPVFMAGIEDRIAGPRNEMQLSRELSCWRFSVT
jgi:hypothetical protein